MHSASVCHCVCIAYVYVPYHLNALAYVLCIFCGTEQHCLAVNIICWGVPFKCNLFYFTLQGPASQPDKPCHNPDTDMQSPASRLTQVVPPMPSSITVSTTEDIPTTSYAIYKYVC